MNCRVALFAAMVALGSQAAAQDRPLLTPESPRITGSDALRNDQPPNATLLEKATLYVMQFRTTFSRVIGIEHYQQTVRRSSVHKGPRSRRLESEVFTTPVGNSETYMTVRSVLKVDGKSVTGAHERLTSILAAAASDRSSQLKTLASEGARYNLGSVGRTFNDPTLALMFLSTSLRGRFAFKTLESTRADAAWIHHLHFTETTRPSLIRDDRDNLDAEISGTVDLNDDGSIMATHLIVIIPARVTARVHVTYRYDSKLDMLVPASMIEDYRNDDGNERGVTLITCAARYSDYRRFETSGRILPQ
jgi:hypothetical protein